MNNWCKLLIDNSEYIRSFPENILAESFFAGLPNGSFQYKSFFHRRYSRQMDNIHYCHIETYEDTSGIISKQWLPLILDEFYDSFNAISPEGVLYRKVNDWVPIAESLESYITSSGISMYSYSNLFRNREYEIKESRKSMSHVCEDLLANNKNINIIYAESFFVWLEIKGELIIKLCRSLTNLQETTIFEKR
jgi:hypothetical protein